MIDGKRRNGRSANAFRLQDSPQTSGNGVSLVIVNISGREDRRQFAGQSECMPAKTMRKSSLSSMIERQGRSLNVTHTTEGTWALALLTALGTIVTSTTMASCAVGVANNMVLPTLEVLQPQLTSTQRNSITLTKQFQTLGFAKCSASGKSVGACSPPPTYCHSRIASPLTHASVFNLKRSGRPKAKKAVRNFPVVESSGDKFGSTARS